MKSHKVSISGIPYGHSKPNGDKKALSRWTASVIKQTVHLPKILHPCLVRVTFRLPPDKFPKDHPYGSDLDNLLKRFFDALIETVFAEAPGKDGIVVSIEATKVKVGNREDAGADLEIIQIEKSC
jgi:Holliday junction resolvase RusA-like endonuclease